MDTSSAAAVARELGTSIPRVMRAADRLGVQPRRHGSGTGSRVRFTPEQIDQLTDELGVVRAPGSLTRTQASALAALARSSRGLLSARAVAKRAAISPTTASRALADLEARGLVTRELRRVALGSVRDVEVLRVNTHSPEWQALAPFLARVRPAKKHVAPRSRRVPNELRHLFWNTAETQLNVERDGAYIARRLIQTRNLDGLAWGAANLSASDWRHAADTRGLDPASRALALNLSHAVDK